MMKQTFVPESECSARVKRLQQSLAGAGLDGAMVLEYVELYYYTGTVQNGLLFVPAQGEPVLYVRRNIERALMESPLKAIRPFTSYKDIAADLNTRGYACRRIGIDENAVTLTYFKLLKKNFPETEFSDIGLFLRKIRAVKSPYEIEKMQKAGEVGRLVMAKVPGLLRPGITEWELALRLFQESASLGETCLARLAFNSGEFFLGNICFGDSSNYPTAFDGPGGIPGKSPACPYGGSDRKLKQGDLVFIDIGFPYQDYYVDKTRLFSLGCPDPAVLEQHEQCLRIQEAVRERLKPGAVPSKVYEEVYETLVLQPGFDDHFMGFGSNKVKFLGHGIGLVINEYPVIARKFDSPLEENMTLAVEPKKGIAGKGMVGIENTFQVTPGGGVCLTADSDAIAIL